MPHAEGSADFIGKNPASGGARPVQGRCKAGARPEQGRSKAGARRSRPDTRSKFWSSEPDLETITDRSGLKNDAGSCKNQLLRPILRPFRGQITFRRFLRPEEGCTDRARTVQGPCKDLARGFFSIIFFLIEYYSITFCSLCWF